MTHNFYYPSAEMQVNDVLEEGFKPIAVVEHKSVSECGIRTYFLLREVDTLNTRIVVVSPLFSKEEATLLDDLCTELGLGFSLRNWTLNQDQTKEATGICYLYQADKVVAQLGKVNGLFCIVPYFLPQLIADSCLRFTLNRFVYSMAIAK